MGPEVGWHWVQLVSVALAIGSIIMSVMHDIAAGSCKTLEKFSEAWDHLQKSRLALFFAMMFVLLGLAATYQL